MKRTGYFWTVLLAVVAAAAITLTSAGCPKHKGEHPSGVEHPSKSEHPAKKEHPAKTEHPKAEHPKAEHPK